MSQSVISSFFAKKDGRSTKKPPEVIVIQDDEENEGGNRSQDEALLMGETTEQGQACFDFSPSVRRSAQFQKAIGAAFGDTTVKAAVASSSCEGKKKNNEGYTPLEKQVMALKEKHPGVLLMVECGYKIRFFGEDALTAAKILKVWARKDHNFQVAWVPTHRFLVHARRLLSAGCRIGLVRQMETASMHKAASRPSGKMFERSCTGVYTPGTSIDEDDPAFSDLIKLRSSSSTPEGHDEEGDDDDDAGTDMKYQDLWLATIVSDDVKGATAVVSVNLRANVVRHRLFTGHQHAREREVADYLDLLRPVEVVVDEGVSNELWRMTLERCAGEVAVAKKEGAGKVTGGQDSAVVSMLPDAPIKRLSRLRLTLPPFSSPPSLSASLTEDQHLSSCENSALRGLSGYLHSLLLEEALKDCSLTSDNSNESAPKVSITDKSTALLSSSSTIAASSPIESKGFRLDPVTAKDLEIFAADSTVSQSRATAGKGDSGTGATVLPCLFNEMNSCRTSFGYRLLKEWLSTPLTDVAAIQERQAAVKWLVAAQHEGGLSKKAPTTPRAAWLGNANKILGGGGGNIEQLLAALQQGKLSPARLVVLLQWAVNVKGLLCTAETAQDMAPPLVLASIIRSKHLEEASDTAQTLLTRLSSFTHAQTAGTLSSMGDDGILVSLECGLQERFPDLAQKIAVLKGCEEDMVIHLERVRKLLRKPALQYRTLNTGGGSCLEHLIEVDAKDVAANPALVPAEWVQTNSTKTVLRYHPPEVIKSQESLILARDEVSIAAKQAWRVFLLEEAKPELTAPLRAAIQSLSVIDCLLSLAKLACRPGYVCPEFSTETEEERVTINLKGARHPVAERLLEKAGSNTPFQPNDVVLRCQGADRSCLVVTGPNMGGKSTYVKMASTLCLMGQVGSFVPAEQAKLPILDNILTRMGAGDDLASGRSTFATELYRTSSILRRATARSLVVLDELGRGTSTHDGVCIAVSTLRHLVCNIGCALFFVTHYSQASDLVSMVNGSPVKDLSEQDRPLRGKVENIHMSYLQSDAIDETNDVSSVTPAGSVVFLYRAVDGAAEGSFGLNVARLAGLSEEFLELAHKRSQWMRYHIQQCGLHGMPRSSSSSFSPESSLRKRKADGSNATLGVTKKTAIEVEEKEDNEHNKKVYQQEPSEGGEDQEEEALRRIIEESQRRLQQLSAKKVRHLSDGEHIKAADADSENVPQHAYMGVDVVAEQVGGGTWQGMVEAGDMAAAAEILGREHVLTGTVVHGEKRGRTIGYPTANLGVDSTPHNVVPADGVYAGWLTVSGKRLRAAISIGTNPTFEGARSRQVEAFALRQEEWLDLYDLPAAITFKARLRPTVKFDGLEPLLEQMKADCDQAWVLTEVVENES